jgi:hypothetical protein
MHVGTFACNGEYWIIGYDESTFSLRDLRGLHYVQLLLKHPGREFHVLDLIHGAGPQANYESATRDVDLARQDDPTVNVDEPGGAAEFDNPTAEVSSLLQDVLHVGLGDAGELIDAQAKKDYRRRYLALKEELEELLMRGDVDRAEEIKSEIDFLGRELARGVGLGGRTRRAGSISERARISVQRAIKAAINRISEHHRALGDLLSHSVKTGYLCSYVPASPPSIAWQFSTQRPKSSLQVQEVEEVGVPMLLRPEASLAGTLKDRTRFVGREEERATLRQCLEQVIGGSGKVVMISGAPGVGKSRLAGEIAAEAIEKGFVALLGDCYEGDDTVPFMPVVEILEAALAQAASREVFRQWLGDDAAELARLMPQLRRIFTDIPPPLEVSPEHSRRILFRGVAEVLARAAGNRPLLLLLEDLHWADEGTLSLLNYLARWVPRVPVMIVGTYREKEIDPAHGLARVIEDFIRLHVVERIDLEGLPHHAVADMIEALSGRKTPATLVALIYSNTEGNPFFIEELYQHLVERGNLVDPSGEFRTISRKSTFPRACAW